MSMLDVRNRNMTGESTIFYKHVYVVHAFLVGALPPDLVTVVRLRIALSLTRANWDIDIPCRN